MWMEERTTFEGKHYRLKDALCEPKPVQSPSIPLWVGGMGERRTLRVVAEVADGWNTFWMPEEQYGHKLKVLAGHCKDFRRDPSDIRKQIGVSVMLGETEADVEDRVKERASTTGIDEDLLRRRFMATTPERCAEALRPFREMGVGDFLMVARPPADGRTMELFAKQVAPALKS
jgi:alkanesulfonate monooxygenase SsuD/methylene tetrahydromethanopterin reductase-like flavin-dependent oxidoreductase (luciferase family)